MAGTSSEQSAAYPAVRNPLWLMDVDGVLNAVCAEPAEGYERVKVDRWPITYSRAILDRISDLHLSGAAEVRWLTTWCHDAATLLAPALRLPEWAVEGYDDWKGSRGSFWWKSLTAKRLSDADPTRPLIWTDDDLAYADRLGEVTWLSEREGPSLTISVNTETGLTPGNLDQIEAFIGMVRIPLSEASA